MFIIAQHINGIFLNPVEYALDADGNVLKFKNQDEAINFMYENSTNPECVDEDLDSGALLILEDKDENV